MGSEISGAESGVTTPGASRLQASQLQQRSTTMQRLHGVGVAASALSGAAFHSLMRPVSPVAGLSRRPETSWDTKAVDPKAAPAWRHCTMGCSCSATSGS